MTELTGPANSNMGKQDTNAEVLAPLFGSENSQPSDLADLQPVPSALQVLPLPVLKFLSFLCGRDLVIPVEEKQIFKIKCNLVPASFVILFATVMIGLTVLAWVFAANLLAPIGLVFQLGVIVFVMAAASSLRLRISQDGIFADSAIHKESLYKRNFRSWSDLHSVRLRKLKSPARILERLKLTREARLNRRSIGHEVLNFFGKGWNQQGFLILDFKSGGNIPLPLAGLPGESLEDLFLALSRFADPMTMNPDVIALQRDILTGQELQLSDNYTKMWEDSLKHSFEVTNFVPLLGGESLKKGELKVLMLLACGGMSSVYLARDSFGNRFVVKEIAVPTEHSDEARRKIHELFAREAQILARLDHAQIVKVVDHFVENSRDYLILEFVPGLTLRQHVQMTGKFSEKEVATIARQIAQVLSYLHQHDPPIIHRDITPDNLIIREPDRMITLIDFGAANEFIGSVTGTLIGKQCYIPPEQFQGKAVPQSDIYAAGATLHFLLTGEDPEPISCSHPKETVKEVSSAMDDVVAKATAVEVKERFKSVEELLQSLDEIAQKARNHG